MMITGNVLNFSKFVNNIPLSRTGFHSAQAYTDHAVVPWSKNTCIHTYMLMCTKELTLTVFMLQTDSLSSGTFVIPALHTQKRFFF
jgi:hypothetical protein